MGIKRALLYNKHHYYTANLTWVKPCVIVLPPCQPLPLYNAPNAASVGKNCGLNSTTLPYSMSCAFDTTPIKSLRHINGSKVLAFCAHSIVLL